jgi:hypothetical protein
MLFVLLAGTAFAAATAQVTVPAPEIRKPSPLVGCGDLGGRCCRPPSSVSIPGLGPLVSCDRGMGCDVAADRCVQPCGGEGQVCCDGPETRALKWTDEGAVFSPDAPPGLAPLREMCDRGGCDRPTHRCFACGTTAGAACCPPDAAQATARCVGDRHLECEFDAGSTVSGTCIACGAQGKPPCFWGCDPGLDLRRGLCDLCGADGQPPCDRGCDKGLEIADGLCRHCGLRGQIPCDLCGPAGCAKTCKFPFRVIRGLCDLCGREGQVPCDAGCEPGLVLKQGVCARPSCGNDGQPPCADGCQRPLQPVGGLCRRCGGLEEPPCAAGCNYPLKAAGGLCRFCGGNTQPPCDGTGCVSGLVVTNGRCGPPDPQGPDTCARLGEVCVADFVAGPHCCQSMGAPAICNFGRCTACVLHGEECKAFQTQICCSAPNLDMCVLDPFSGKSVCQIPDFEKKKN